MSVYLLIQETLENKNIDEWHRFQNHQYACNDIMPRK